MDLQEFIRETLVQITRGVHDAQKEVGSTAIINPTMRLNISKDERGRETAQVDMESLKDTKLMPTNIRHSVATMVEFDIAVTVESKKGESSEVSGTAKGAGNIYVVNLSAELSGKTGDSSESTENRVSRIKFSVPVQFHRAT